MTAKLYDVFISHAYEDKNEFANTLAMALKKKGLKIWYSGLELKLGDSITDNINDALKNSRFGIVLISPVYLEKKWAMNELKSLFSIEAENSHVLPILHGITINEIKKSLPVLADRFAISSDQGIQIVVNRILQAVNGKRKYTKSKNVKGKKNTVAPKAKKPKSKIEKAGVTITDSGFIMLGGNLNVKAKEVAGRDIKKTKK
ncbi:MAG: toll/interleukin-1 receptor domain-containing protein [Bacteroidota bacterium]|nr:toll/interleukin-1 receptor domain-containing protein [Bacteroidota bacterium]